MGSKTRAQEFDELLGFNPCPFCSYDVATGEGQRGCHYYACPYLPEELDPHCPRCRYNFATDDIVAECGDPPSCEFATEEAPRRLEALSYWIANH